MKIAIVTYQELNVFKSDVPNEDEMLLNLFHHKGYSPSYTIWDDESVDWSQYDALIIKSTWDYFFDKIDRFYQWLEHVQALGIRCFNPPDLVRWNADKIYLKDIAEQGFRTVPTLYIDKDLVFEPSYYFDHFGTDRLIIKPRISGGAKNTILVNADTPASGLKEINGLLKQEHYMVQPFIAEIEQEGEWSMIFFGGKFSHHLLKVAKPGDFRVQHVYGGSIHKPALPENLLEQAEAIVKQFAPDSLYARVDGVQVNGDLWLMELELIEPYLFFFTDKDSLERYYSALQDKLNV
jgi:glutathione synthase/RimK-type ligase-like ATP-grasp enzyme